MARSANAILRNALEALEREAADAIKLIEHHKEGLAQAEDDLAETSGAILELRNLLRERTAPKSTLAGVFAEVFPPVKDAPPAPFELADADQAKAIADAIDAAPRQPDGWTPFEEREPPLVPQIGNGPSATALTPEQVSARRMEVMDALQRLWDKGGRVIAADVVKETTLTQYQVYQAVSELAAAAEIVTVKEPVRPGDKRMVKAIYPKDHPAIEPAPIVKVAPKVARAAIKAAKEVAPGKSDRRQRMLAGAAIREAPGNTMAIDVATAVGVDAMQLTPGMLRQAGITEAEIDVTRAILMERCTFEELAPGQCKWEVTGSQDRDAYRFCGHKGLDDGPYCAAHEYDAHHAKGLHQPADGEDGRASA